MAESRESTILDVKLDAGKVAQDLQDLITRIAALKAQQKSLNEEIKAGNDIDGKYAEQLIRVKDQLAWTEKQAKGLSATTKLLNADTLTYSDSLNGERQKLADMQKAYDQLDRTQRESEGGKAFLEAIKAQSDAVKGLEEETGRAQRNVGNYPKAWGAAIPGLDKATEVLSKMGVTMEDLQNKGIKAFSGLGQSIKAFGKAFITPPIVVITAVLGAIMAIVNKVSEAFKKNDAAMTSLQKAFAAFQVPAQTAAAIFDKIAESVGRAAEAGAKMVAWLADKISPGYAEAANEATKLVQAQDDLEEAERQYTVNSAERNREISRLRAEAADREKYTAEERKQRLHDAIDLEKQNLEDEKAIKAEQLRILEETAKREQDTSDETANKIAAARAAMYQAEQSYYDGVRSLETQLTSFDKEEAERKKKAVEDARKAAAVRLEINRALQDVMIAMDTDAVSRQVNTLKVAGEREVENLKIKLNNLKKNDKKAREELQKLIVAKEQETQKRIDEILTEAAEKRAAALRANAYSEMELLTTDALKLAEFRKAQAEQELQGLQELSDEKRRILYDTEEEYNAAVLEARKKLADESIAVQEEMYNRKQLAEQNEYARELQNIQEGDAVAIAEAELARAQEEQEELVNIDAETKRLLYKSEEEYEAAIIAGENRVTAAKKKAVEEQRKMAISNANAITGAMDSLSNLLDQFGDKNAAAARASKAIALGKVAVETGVAIASGVAQAQSMPFPANIAAIATTIATILANIATAVTMIKGANFNSDAGNYAGGGTIPGTSYTGDRLIAHVNSGEGIYTGTQANNLLQEIANNPLRGGASEEMAAAMAAAVAAMPAPVMVFREFRDFEQQVSTYNEFASI